MATYKGNYTCGHEGIENIVGPSKDREWKKDRAFNKLCPDCWKKKLEEERAAANAEALKKAKEMELPELEGSEKQIAWANTIRQGLVDKVASALEEVGKKTIVDMEAFEEGVRKVEITRDYVLETKTSAKWYIENRGMDVNEMLEECMVEALKHDEEKAKTTCEDKLEIEIKLENTVYPENKVTDAIVEVYVLDDDLVARFSKDDVAREVVKTLKLKWDGGKWRRKLVKVNGCPVDRAVELANKLLENGVPVSADVDIRERAIAGDYEPEHTRWIWISTAGEYNGFLLIEWEGYDDRLYNAARKIPESKWSGGIVVKLDYAEEVKEFAELFDFKFSDGALKAIELFEKAKSGIETISVKKGPESEYKDGLQDILKGSAGVLDDLKD